MDIQTHYCYLVERPDKGTQELYIRGTGIRASTLWHDRYVSQMHPRAIAQDHDLPVEAVYEALAYCQEHRDVICQAKAQEHAWLQDRGFFPAQLADPA